LARYDYLDELDCVGWAWEFLRRTDEYRADYDRLQTLEQSDSKHIGLAKKWHVKRMLDPTLRELPEFYCEEFEQIHLDRLWQQDQHACLAFKIENQPPRFNHDTWKRAIICKDLTSKESGPTNIARSFYTGHNGKSHKREHHPARHRVRYGLHKFEKLQHEYLKIAYIRNLRL